MKIEYLLASDSPNSPRRKGEGYIDQHANLHLVEPDEYTVERVIPAHQLRAVNLMRDNA